MNYCGGIIEIDYASLSEKEIDEICQQREREIEEGIRFTVINPLIPLTDEIKEAINYPNRYALGAGATLINE